MPKRQQVDHRSMIGATFGTFMVLDHLGTGTSGDVYLAEDQQLLRKVALKVIARRPDDDSASRETFLLEARAAARVIHPNVVQIFQIGETDTHRYIAMEYVAGDSLLTRARRAGGRIEEASAVPWMLQCARALQAAAELGLVHRDIKPGNLLLSANEEAKVADFGLAAFVDPESTLHGPTSAEVSGTPAYMAPEQWLSEPLSGKTDIYALGCSFFRLVTGAYPFRGRDLPAFFRAHMESTPHHPHDLVPELSIEFSRVLLACLHKVPARRPTAAELVAMLEPLRQRSGSRPIIDPGHPPAARPPSESLRETSGVDPTLGSGSFPEARTFPGLNPYSSTPLERADFRNVYGLDQRPFSDLRRPDLFWDQGPFAVLLERMERHFLNSSSPLVITGAAGSGRTYLAEAFGHRVPDLTTIVVEAAYLMNSTLLMAACRHQGIAVDPEDSPASMLQALRTELLDDPSTALLIVVDGVERLSNELSAELAHILAAPGGSEVRFLLTGPPRLQPDLQRAEVPDALRPDEAAFLSIPALNADEAAEYLRFRVMAAGAVDVPELERAAVQLVHARTRGNPRRLGVVGHNALVLGALRREPMFGFEALRLALKSKTYLTTASAEALLTPKT